MKLSEGIGRVIIFKGKQKAVPLHAHHSLIIGMHLKGKREMLFGRESLMIAENTPYVISPELLHGVKPVKTESFKGVLVLVNLKVLPPFFQEASKARFPVQSERYKKIIPLLDGLEDGEIGLKWMEDIWEVLKPEKCSPPEILDGRMLKARDLLVSDIEMNIKIKEIARSIGMSPYHFIRVFTTVFGTTPHAYRNILRIQNAKKFLKDGMAQAECACSCGFADQSHLHRHFHRQVGVSPAQYL